MKLIYSKKDKTKLLHIINRFEEIAKRTNVAPEEQFLQLATLKMNSGDTFKPHQHIWKKSDRLKIIAQESWVVIKGEIEVSFFDIDGTFLHKGVLYEGDCSISLHGGHSYSALTNSLVYEFKNGPYLGQKKDKKFIKDML